MLFVVFTSCTAVGLRTVNLEYFLFLYARPQQVCLAAVPSPDAERADSLQA